MDEWLRGVSDDLPLPAGSAEGDLENTRLPVLGGQGLQ